MNWIDSYYEALEFLFWEPQHIGRKRNPGSELNSLEIVVKRLRRLEVTLNHNIHQFFLLAPASLRQHLFEQVFSGPFIEHFKLHGRNVDSEFVLKNSAQPDLLFESSNEVVSIEMKLGAKCSLEQVLKYALLGLAVELKVGKPIDHYLIILGFGNFQRQFRDQFDTPADLSRAIASTDLSVFSQRLPAHFRDHEERFAMIARNMPVAFLSYQELATFLRVVTPEASDKSLGAEVYRNLTLGLVHELTRRQLAT